MTKMTATPMPSAVSNFLETPIKGQIPRNFTRMNRLQIKNIAFFIKESNGIDNIFPIFKYGCNRLVFCKNSC